MNNIDELIGNVAKYLDSNDFVQSETNCKECGWTGQIKEARRGQKAKKPHSNDRQWRVFCPNCGMVIMQLDYSETDILPGVKPIAGVRINVELCEYECHK